MKYMPMPEKVRRREIELNCPEGYKLVRDGQTVDMLGATELWRIYENHPEPHLARIPQDLIDVEGVPCAGRAPKDWGQCIYYKVL